MEKEQLEQLFKKIATEIFLFTFSGILFAFRGKPAITLEPIELTLNYKKSNSIDFIVLTEPFRVLDDHFVLQFVIQEKVVKLFLDRKVELPSLTVKTIDIFVAYVQFKVNIVTYMDDWINR